MKQTITPEEFLSATNVNRILIECIFAQEESFIENVIRTKVRIPCEFTIDKVYFSGYRANITILFEDDISKKDIVIDLAEVYDWYCDEHKRLERG